MPSTFPPEFHAIERGYATIPQGQVHLRRIAGQPDHIPLILLHASPASSQSLEPLMHVLAGERTLVGFDTPCNGQSCRPDKDQPELGDFAAMLDSACDALGHDRIALYGTHTGAHIAMEWALARPDRIAGLILDGVALLDDAMRTEFLDRYAPPKAPDESGAQFQWAWHYVRDQMIFFPHYAKDDAHRRIGGRFDADTLHALTLDVLNSLTTYHLPYHAVFRHDARGALARIALPTLIVAGDGEPLDYATAELEALVPNAIVARGCHETAEKGHAIQAFLNSLGDR